MPPLEIVGFHCSFRLSNSFGVPYHKFRMRKIQNCCDLWCAHFFFFNHSQPDSRLKKHQISKQAKKPWPKGPNNELTNHTPSNLCTCAHSAWAFHQQEIVKTTNIGPPTERISSWAEALRKGKVMKLRRRSVNCYSWGSSNTKIVLTRKSQTQR